jgi:4-hydroxy-tetrahydrodipicolinate reductase
VGRSQGIGISTGGPDGQRKMSIAGSGKGKTLKIGIVGCAGRMGRTLVAEIAVTDDVVLGGGGEQAESPFIGQDVAVLAGLPAAGIAVGSDVAALFAVCDAVIDFTAAPAAPIHAGLAANSGTVLVIGTTGLDAVQQQAVEAAAAKTAIVQAANMSVGVNLLLGLTRQVAAVLGEDYDIEVIEMHHRHKADAPSGTALALGRAAADGRAVALDDKAQRTRDGIVGARRAGDIGFATLRGGDVVGEHTVIFATDGERIELSHKASSRRVFAKGAVRAALWAGGKPPGLFSMIDVLGLV